MSDVSAREVCTYVVCDVLEKKVAELLSDEYFDSEAFHAFMSENFPTYSVTKGRKTQMKNHFGKLMERAIRPIKTTLESYNKD